MNQEFDLKFAAYLNYIVSDYKSLGGTYEPHMYSVEAKQGKKFVKVLSLSHGSRSVHTFVCKVAHDKWKEGDILKAASFNAPAKNFARGNIFDGNFENVTWTGAH